MGTLANGEIVAPFANAAMRLLREDWQGKYGSKMLAEELYPILQTGIPQPNQQFQNFITVNAGEDGKLLSLIDQFGNEIYKIDEFGPNEVNKGLQPVEPTNYPPPKLKPRIVWDEKTINAGDAIGAGELDAVAVDPETGAEVPGVYVYDPVSGTVFSSGGTASLYVQFTPTDGVKYRRAKGRTTLHITASSLLIPDIIWPTPDDIWKGTAMSATQYNATAQDPITSAPVAGTFVYNPVIGTTPDLGDFNPTVTFFPTNTAVYATAGPQGVSFVVKGIAFVQDSSGGNLNLTAGNLIVVAVATIHTAFGVTVAVSDSQGNSYTQCGIYNEQVFGVGFVRISLWRAVAGSTGSTSWTVTPSAGSNQTVKIVEYNGQHPSSGGFDAFDDASGFGGDPPETGTPAINADRELVVSFLAGDNASATTTTGFFSRGGLTQYRDNVDVRAVTSGFVAPKGGANTPVDAVGGTASSFWCGISASFKHRTS